MMRTEGAAVVASLFAAASIVLSACGPMPDVVSSTPSEITLRTRGDMAMAETRARAYCGRRMTGLLTYTAPGPDQTATFRCL